MADFYTQGNYYGGSGGGGHTIVDSNNTEFTDRDKLKFVNATITDDSENEVTVVTVEGGVKTFNGRSGSVLPVAGDYDATQVNYSSSQTVKQKIDSLITGVSSFNNRSGSITPTAGDYDATQINYDNNTTVKQKIDSINVGVTSFNTRSGAVSPTSGDYNSSQITHNSTSNVSIYLGVWTPAVSCSIGAETATITNANIHTTSIITSYAETASGAPVNFSTIEVSEGSAVITFTSALEEAASIKLHILNI